MVCVLQYDGKTSQKLNQLEHQDPACTCQNAKVFL
jgi:hypothetical protein